VDAFVIRGGRPLRGRVEIGGSKNTVLPIMAACLLAEGRHTIENVPELRDVGTMSRLIGLLGAATERNGDVLTIETRPSDEAEAPYELVKTMRASIYVLGPLLARRGVGRVSLPGGCAWGPRPVDLHLGGLEKMGAEIVLEHGYIVARAPKRLAGAQIHFPQPSGGATAHLMMAAALAEGTTVITNAAMEPEIPALAEFLTSMGGRVEGAGTTRVEIEGVRSLSPGRIRVVPDRIEMGTYAVAAAITGGDLVLSGRMSDCAAAVGLALAEAGVSVEENGDATRIARTSPLRSIDISTAPYPGFPTDMQAQMMALMTIAGGRSVITDTIYSDRFTHVAELRRLGADIELLGNSAIVTSVERLFGAPVMATDLRASAALVIAALVADGETKVSRVYHIDRGYASIEAKLRAAGAEITRIRE
jgi:UDP-N-acetylglucosamine 1-carboxyvinyltransferase